MAHIKYNHLNLGSLSQNSMTRLLHISTNGDSPYRALVEKITQYFMLSSISNSLTWTKVSIKVLPFFHHNFTAQSIPIYPYFYKILIFICRELSDATTTPYCGEIDQYSFQSGLPSPLIVTNNPLFVLVHYLYLVFLARRDYFLIDIKLCYWTSNLFKLLKY